MTGLRLLLAAILATVTLYTVPVALQHGINLFPFFFGDIAAMGWPGQFNVDFLGFLTLSAVWTAWRNRFTGTGMGLGVLAFFFGAPFLTTYLLFLSYRTNGDIPAMLLGPERGSA